MHWYITLFIFTCICSLITVMEHHGWGSHLIKPKRLLIQGLPRNAEITPLLPNHDKKTTSQFILLLLSIILILFAGSRGDGVGFDRLIYYGAYANQTNDFEFGYILLGRLFFYLFGERGFGLFLLSISTATIFFLVKSLKQLTPLPTIALSYYLGAHYLQQCMGQIRQGLAIAISFIAIKYIYERNLNRFILVILCGAMFHVSVLAMLPFYYIAPLRLNKKAIYLLVTTCFVWGFLFKSLDHASPFLLQSVPIDFFRDRINAYILTDSSYTSGIDFSLTVLERILLAAVAILYINKPKNKYYNLAAKLYFYSVIMYFLLSPFNIVAGRFSLPMKTYELIIIPTLIVHVSKDRLQKALCTCIVLIIAGGMYYDLVLGNPAFSDYCLWWWQ